MPSRLADEREMKALTRAMGESGRGIFMLTKGGTTSVELLEEIAAACGRPVLIAAMFHNNQAPQRVFDSLRGSADWHSSPTGTTVTIRLPVTS